MSSVDKYPVSLVENEGWDERILVCQCGKMVNCFIIVSDRYVIIVDTMINPQTASAMLDIAGPYITDGRQLLVINTHADFDHCWGNQIFVGQNAIYPAPIFATRRAYDRFTGPEKDLLIPEMKAKDPAVYGDVELTPPTVLFDDQLFIDGGDLSLRLFLTPGHQPDHISILIPEASLLLAGDAAEWPYPFAATPSSMPQMRASLAQMAALNLDSVLYCHAPVSSGPGLLRQNIAYFNMLDQRCREAIDTGLSALPAESDDVAQLVNLPLEDALPPMPDGSPFPDYYYASHAMQIRMMLEFMYATRSATI